MSLSSLSIYVKKYKPGKFRVSFLHTPGKWFVIRAHSPENARDVAKKQESWLLGNASKGIRFGDFANDFYNQNGVWAKYIESKGHSPYGMYYQRLHGYLNNYVLPKFAHMFIDEIDAVTIDSWLMTIKSIKKNEDAAPATRNQILTTMSHIFDYAKYKGILDKNPVKNIKTFRGGKSRPAFALSEIKALFPENEETALNIWPNRLWLTFFLVMRDTGLRTGETLALDWQNYSCEYQCFAVVQKYESSTGRILPGTKTGATKKRAVAITNRTAAVIQLLQKEQGRGGLIFSQDGQKPYTENNVIHRFRYAMERAGIPRVVDGQSRTPYSFRHSFVTNMLSTDLDARDVAVLSGHGIEMQSTYNHPTNNHLYKRIVSLREKIEIYNEG